jgi:hypothetical protein
MIKLQGFLKLMPLTDALFAGQQVVDRFWQIRTIVDPVEKWRDRVTRTEMRAHGFLAKFTRDFDKDRSYKNTGVYDRAHFRELVVNYEIVLNQPKYIPLKYNQWQKALAESFERDKKIDGHLVKFQIETITVGANEFDFTEIDVADVFAYHDKVYSEHEAYLLVEAAFECARGEGYYVNAKEILQNKHKIL